MEQRLISISSIARVIRDAIIEYYKCFDYFPEHEVLLTPRLVTAIKGIAQRHGKTITAAAVTEEQYLAIKPAIERHYSEIRNQFRMGCLWIKIKETKDALKDGRSLTLELPSFEEMLLRQNKRFAGK
jgi:hypothetical protein